MALGELYSFTLSQDLGGWEGWLLSVLVLCTNNVSRVNLPKFIRCIVSCVARYDIVQATFNSPTSQQWPLGQPMGLEDENN